MHSTIVAKKVTFPRVQSQPELQSEKEKEVRNEGKNKRKEMNRKIGVQ